MGGVDGWMNDAEVEREEWKEKGEENQQRRKVRKDEMMKADLWLLAKR